MPSEINASLSQQGMLGQIREYQIQNGQQIKIAIGSTLRNKVYQVHLLALADKSRVRLYIARSWLLCLLGSLLGIPAYYLVKHLLDLRAGAHEFVILVLLSLGVLLGATMLTLNFSRCRVFYSRSAHVPLFDILVNKPDKRSYKQFLDVLNMFINKTRAGRGLRPDQQIAGEIRMLRRLANQGVISQAEYERAKTGLLGVNTAGSRRASQ